MSRLLLIFLVSSAICSAAVGAEVKKASCSADHERQRSEILVQSKCGEPKMVYVQLGPMPAHQQIFPDTVWIKRCVGICDYGGYPTNEELCLPREKQLRDIPVRIYNILTNKEMCAMITAEEHLSCFTC